jgi:pyruvate/2-oxoglutarate dehydrogenase complex dihydrolipoamide dehydrogenase (E3) component
VIEQFDAIVIGAGISGEACAHRLRVNGMRVALIEREAIGGECAYWASIPTATLMGPANSLWRAQALAGMASPAIASPRSLTPSEFLLSALDESTQIEAIEKEGGVFIRAEARFVGQGQIEVGTRRLAAPHIVIATGSEPAIPTIPGLAEAPYWTNREATRVMAVPQQVVVLGGEGQAVEIGQMFRLYGANVHLITRHNHLLIDENPEIGNLLAQRLRRQGVHIALGSIVREVKTAGDNHLLLTLDDTSVIEMQALVVATRRHPRVQELNLEQVGIHPTPTGIAIDQTCRAAEGVWAVGAVTGFASLSHMAQYQARIAADDILGQPHPAQYRSVPRVFYTNPEIAIAGWTGALADEQATTDIVSVSIDLNEKKASPISVRQVEKGKMTLFASVSRGTLIGIWAAATEASEWIQLAIPAIRSETPLDVVRDTMEQFPPFGEAYLGAIDQLIAATSRARTVVAPH